MKVKVSATVSPEHLARAKELTGCQNVSEVLDRGLAALIKVEQERVHARGYENAPQGRDTVTSVEESVWSDLPWDEE